MVGKFIIGVYIHYCSFLVIFLVTVYFAFFILYFIQDGVTKGFYVK